MKSLFRIAALALFVSAAFATKYQNLELSLAQQTPQMNAEHTWVVLVAGSTGYSNYRHQASVCHVYQIAHKFGVPDERIIVFMADDLATSSSNPFPGAIYNYFYIQGGVNINVYPGVVKDYTGTNATADNLVAVLTGEKPLSGSGKVLRSTSKDNVFFYYDDHGNNDIIAMPYGRTFNGSKDLAKVFDVMYEKKMYKNLILFFQACNSGSMFYKQKFPPNTYAATSAPVDKPAYACWRCPILRAYVTSCWPRGWIRPMDEEDPNKVTFEQLFSDSWDFTRNSTEPCQYGDPDVKRFTMKEFFGITNSVEMPLARQTRNLALERESVNVPQYDVPLSLARMRYEETHSEEDAAALRDELVYRQHIDDIVKAIADAAIPGYSNLVASKVCTVCDATCECFNTCMKSGTMDVCKRHCCGYANCYPKTVEMEQEWDCVHTLSQAFANTCGLSKHDYISSATSTFNRICRTPGKNIAAALATMNNLC